MRQLAYIASEMRYFQAFDAFLFASQGMFLKR